MNIEKLLLIGKFMFKFGQNKNSRTYPSRERGDKRHSLVRKQFHYYNIIKDKLLSSNILWITKLCLNYTYKTS